MFENILKYGFLIVTYPIWWPILKTMYAELQAALWREGGLFGREPTARELPALEEKYREFASPLINETLAEYRLREKQEEADRRDLKARGGRPDPLERSDVLNPARRRGTGPSTGGAGGRPAAGGGTRRAPGNAGSHGFRSPAAGPARPRSGF
jgi:hypothetical protein